MGTLTAADPSDGVLPIGCTKMMVIDGDNYIRVAIPNDGTHKGVTTKVKIRITARYFPAIGSLTDESFDWAELYMQIKGQLSGGTTRTYYSVTKYVGLHWTMVEMDVDLPNGTSDPELTIKGTNERPIELAYISFIQ